MFIQRKLSSDLSHWLEAEAHPNIAIVSGVVGCGKTTLIKHFLQSEHVQSQLEIFAFSLDDVTLRRDIADDSNFFVEHVASRTTTQKKSCALLMMYKKVKLCSMR